MFVPRPLLQPPRSCCLVLHVAAQTIFPVQRVSCTADPARSKHRWAPSWRNPSRRRRRIRVMDLAFCGPCRPCRDGAWRWRYVHPAVSACAGWFCALRNLIAAYSPYFIAHAFAVTCSFSLADGHRMYLSDPSMHVPSFLCCWGRCWGTKQKKRRTTRIFFPGGCGGLAALGRNDGVEWLALLHTHARTRTHNIRTRMRTASTLALMTRRTASSGSSMGTAGARCRSTAGQRCSTAF